MPDACCQLKPSAMLGPNMYQMLIDIQYLFVILLKHAQERHGERSEYSHTISMLCARVCMGIQRGGERGRERKRKRGRKRETETEREETGREERGDNDKANIEKSLQLWYWDICMKSMWEKEGFWFSAVSHLVSSNVVPQFQVLGSWTWKWIHLNTEGCLYLLI